MLNYVQKSALFNDMISEIFSGYSLFLVFAILVLAIFIIVFIKLIGKKRFHKALGLSLMVVFLILIPIKLEYDTLKKNGKEYIFNKVLKPKYEKLKDEYIKMDCVNMKDRSCPEIASNLLSLTEEIQGVKKKEGNIYDIFVEYRNYNSDNYYGNKGFLSDNFYENRGYVYEELNMLNVEELEKISKGSFVDDVINKFKKLNFDIEYFEHGRIEALLDDGRILFTDKNNGDLFVYEDGKIYKAPCGNDAKKAEAVLNNDGFIDGIYQIDKNCETYFYIGEKKSKNPNMFSDRKYVYDSAWKMTFNDDKSAFMFLYSGFFSGESLCYKDVSSIKNTNDIMRTLSDKTLEASEAIVDINEKIEKSIVSNVLDRALPEKAKIDGVEPSDMYDIIMGNETEIYDRLFGDKSEERGEESEGNKRNYNFDYIGLYSKEGRRLNIHGAQGMHEMCWTGNHLYFRAWIDWIDDFGDINIYSINLNNIENDHKKEVTMLIENQKDDDENYYFMYGCSEEDRRLYVRSRAGKFGYYDLDTKEIKYLFDAEIAMYYHFNNGKLAFDDESGNSYVLDLK